MQQISPPVFIQAVTLEGKTMVVMSVDGELEATLDVTSMVSIGRDDRVGYGSGGSVGWRK